MKKIKAVFLLSVTFTLTAVGASQSYAYSYSRSSSSFRSSSIRSSSYRSSPSRSYSSRATTIKTTPKVKSASIPKVTPLKPKTITTKKPIVASTPIKTTDKSSKGITQIQNQSPTIIYDNRPLIPWYMWIVMGNTARSSESIQDKYCKKENWDKKLKKCKVDSF